MIAVRCAFSLPRDYDMQRVRSRILEAATALDDYDGLVLAAHCLTEAGVGEASDNVYAPVWVWANTSKMSRYLWGGDGFETLEAAYGRPRLDISPVASLHLNAAGARAAKAMVVHREAARVDESLTETAARLKTEANAAVLRKDTRAAVRVIDGPTADTLGCDLLMAPPRKSAGKVYEVVHVSAPTRA